MQFLRQLILDHSLKLPFDRSGPKSIPRYPLRDGDSPKPSKLMRTLSSAPTNTGRTPAHLASDKERKSVLKFQLLFAYRPADHAWADTSHAVESGHQLLYDHEGDIATADSA